MVEELFIWEILTGKPEIKFKGIYPLIEDYMADQKYSADIVEQIRIYLKFQLARARGEIKTGATLIREFVLSHPEYKHDSIVSNRIAYDLVEAIIDYSRLEHIHTKEGSGTHWVPADLSALYK